MHLQHTYKVHNFYINTMRYSFLLGDSHKFTTNVRDKDHKITKIHHFVASYKHLNVISSIRMLQHSKVHSNIEHSVVLMVPIIKASEKSCLLRIIRIKIFIFFVFLATSWHKRYIRNSAIFHHIIFL